MPPLVIDDTTRARVAEVEEFAFANWYRPGQSETVPGDDPRHTVKLNTYRCVFSYTLAQVHIDFIARLIDRKTAIVTLLSKKNAKYHQEAQENRQEAIRASKAALKAHRQRKTLERRREKERLEKERGKWADEILVNLQAVHRSLLLKTKLLTDEWL